MLYIEQLFQLDTKSSHQSTTTTIKAIPDTIIHIMRQNHSVILSPNSTICQPSSVCDWPDRSPNHSGLVDIQQCLTLLCYPFFGIRSQVMGVPSYLSVIIYTGRCASTQKSKPYVRPDAQSHRQLNWCSYNNREPQTFRGRRNPPSV